MTTYNGSDVAFFLADGYSIRDYLLTLKSTAKGETQDKTPLGWQFKRNLFAGIIDVALECSLLYDDAVGASDDYLRNLATGNAFTADVVCYGLETNTAGKRFVGLQSMNVEADSRGAKKGDIHEMEVSYSNSNEYGQQDGTIIMPLQTVTAAGNTTGVDNGADTTDGGIVYLQVPAITLGGYTNWSLKLQDSADNITFADVAGASAKTFTTSPGSALMAVTGTIRRYTRILYALTGAGADPSLTAFCGLVRY